MRIKTHKQVEMFLLKHVDIGHMIIKACEYRSVCDN